uniref:Immunoglobulin C1-set domain-containing protein n=1 Tax=Oryctolagus cuniculus TaxID=9986 RepID=A0A5F9CYR5_RABIT
MLLLLSVFLLFHNGLICRGKGTMVKPEAWLSRGPSPGPGRLLLVCHVSGFYPKTVWVMMRGDKQQSRTRRGDVLPNADGTWWTLHPPVAHLFDCDCHPVHIGCS